MTKEQKDASNNREERFIELGRDGSLNLSRERFHWLQKAGDWYDHEMISGTVKGHRVDIHKYSDTHTPTADGYQELKGYKYSGSVDGRVKLSAREAEKLFRNYTGMASDEEMESLEEKARESVKQEGAAFEKTQEHDKVVSELLGE